MKKKILGLAILAGATMLTGCIDPSDDNSAVLQNSLLTEEYSGGTGMAAGFNESIIPGFENSSGENPTPVTLIYSNATLALNAGCIIRAPNNNAITSLTATSESLDLTNYSMAFNSLTGDMTCRAALASTGPYTANVRISFTAGGKSYSATTTLTADGGV